MPALFKDKEHLLRVAVLFLGGIVAFLVLQQLLVPPGFGAFGHYRAGALGDNRSRPLRYAGQGTCVECHTDIAETRAHGKHGHVACEACHGALAAHAADPEAVKPVRPDPKALCPVCHTANVAKPSPFPQIDRAEHPDGVCTECHVAHDPGSAPETTK
jgi:Cytochrome c7 and related cytochrome c